MRTTLQIDDEDAVSIVDDLEASFGLTISDAEAAAMRTLGDVYDFIQRQVFENGVGGQSCASALAFYRLRRGLSPLAPGGKLSPSTRLVDITNWSAKRIIKYAEAQTGLRLPRRSMSWIGSVGEAGMLLGFLATVVVFMTLGVWGWAPAALAFVGGVLVRVDPGKIPENCATIGDLATTVCTYNFGCFAREGARVNATELWKTLTAIVSRYSPVPAAEMRAEALLLESQSRVA